MHREIICFKIFVGVTEKILIAFYQTGISGGIDPHTHMEMPFMGDESCDDFFSGQAAALAGGTTMHIDFALPDSAGDLAAGYEAYTKKAEKSCMDYGFHMAVTKWNDKVAATMEWLVKEKGACHVKLMPWQT